MINTITYKKWMLKFTAENARLNEELEYLERMEDEIEQDLLVLPYMVSLPPVFTDSLLQQHAIIKQVFKDGLTNR